MIFFTKRNNGIDYLPPPIGTSWTFIKNEVFNVPATGKYSLQMHGGGAGGASIYGLYGWIGGPGGGSGNKEEIQLNYGQSINITIGQPGTGHQDGQPTSFGEYTINGGDKARVVSQSGGGYNVYPGEGVGNLAQGRLGDKNNPTQPYGNGGEGNYAGQQNSGTPGAVILTYLGK